MKHTFIFVALFALIACSNNRYEMPASAPNVKNEQELLTIEKDAEASPTNLVLRAHLARQKDYLINKMLNEAEMAKADSNLELAADLYKRILAINPSASQATNGLLDVESVKRQNKWIAEAEDWISQGKYSEAEASLSKVLTESPKNLKAKALLKKASSRHADANGISPLLKTSFNKPVTLEFKDAGLKVVFEVLSRAGGINFIFDKDVKADARATIFVRNIRIEDAIGILLTTNQLQYKVMTDNTLLIYPNSPSKLKEYQELTVRNFYLANSDVKQVASLLKTITKNNEIHVDEKLNLIVIRDTPEVIKLASKLIESQDMAEPEVMLEMEVLEVSRNRLQELGMRYPDQFSLSAVGANNTAGTLSINEWKSLNSGMVRLSVTNPSFILNLKRTDTDTNLLANPRIRVRNREKAKIHIGEKVPVITTTSTANVGVAESVTYLDVGLKLDIVPNVYLYNEVAMKVALEVSNILETIKTNSGTQTYRLGTRNTETTLRLQDGETQVLAGLIQEDERKTSNKVPGFGSLPIIGRLFSNNNDSKVKTEIVLLITPHVIRNISQPEYSDSEYPSGTFDNVGKVPMPRMGTRSELGSKVDAQTKSPTGSTEKIGDQVIEVLQPNLPQKANSPSSSSQTQSQEASQILLLKPKSVE